MKNSIAIKTESLTKKYDDKTAVNALDLTVMEGELFSLLGVNGAGKTTTIRMLSCLSTPTAGRAEVFGHDVVKEPDAVKQLVGISTQDTAVAEKLTIYENLVFMAEIYGKEKADADRVIDVFGLGEVRNKRAKTLSGGWKRRLSIAMGIIGDPKLLFLDEPTLGLDVLARRELWRFVKKLKSKVTIVLTTHYLDEVEALCDTIAIMAKGHVLAVGNADELKKSVNKDSLEDAFVEIVGGEKK